MTSLINLGALRTGMRHVLSNLCISGASERQKTVVFNIFANFIYTLYCNLSCIEVLITGQVTQLNNIIIVSTELAFKQENVATRKFSGVGG